jgi:hypothetical protein
VPRLFELGGYFPRESQDHRVGLARFHFPPSGESALFRPAQAGERAEEKGAGLARMFELEELIFDAEFLSFQMGQGFFVGMRSLIFAVDFVVQVAVTGAKLFDTIIQRHGSS